MGDPESSDSRIRVLHAASTEQPETLNWDLSEITIKGLPDLLNPGGYSIIFASLKQKHTDYKDLLATCGLPVWLAKAPYSNSNGFSGCQVIYSNDVPKFLVSWFRFSVQTLAEDSFRTCSMTFVSLWRDRSNVAFFCFDVPNIMQEMLGADIVTVYDSNLFDSPSSLHSIVVEAVVQQYDQSMQVILNRPRTTDGTRYLKIENGIEETRITEYKEVGQVLIQLGCDIQTALGSLRNMISQHTEFLDEWDSLSNYEVRLAYSRNTATSLQLYLSMLENIHNQNQAIVARLRHEEDVIRLEMTATLTRLNRDLVRMNYLSQNISRSYGSIFFILLPGIFTSTLLSSGIVDPSNNLVVWLAITCPLTFVAVWIGFYLPVARAIISELLVRILNLRFVMAHKGQGDSLETPSDIQLHDQLPSYRTI